MVRPFIVMRRYPYEEPYHLRLVLSAGNGVFAGSLEYYCNADDLAAVGHRLMTFPTKVGDSYAYELGSFKEEDRFAFHLLLNVRTSDSAGHCSLRISMSNNRPEPDKGSCTFCIQIEPSAVNRLGSLLRAFGELKHLELRWSDVDSGLFSEYQTSDSR
jgi:hypothetical protein